MSWAKEEWKEGLTLNVLNKIHSLEDQNVQLKSDLKQKQFNCDSLQASVDKYVSFLTLLFSIFLLLYVCFVVK